MKKVLITSVLALLSVSSMASNFGRKYCECSVKEVVEQAVAYCGYVNRTHPCSITSVEQLEDVENVCSQVTRECAQEDVKLYEVMFGGK